VGHTTRADVLKALDAAGVDVVRSTPIPCEEVVCAAVSETSHVRPEHVQAAEQVVRDFASREAQELQAKSRVRVAYGRQCEPPPPHAPTAARLRAALALAGIEVYAQEPAAVCEACSCPAVAYLLVVSPERADEATRVVAEVLTGAVP